MTCKNNVTKRLKCKKAVCGKCTVKVLSAQSVLKGHKNNLAYSKSHWV